MFTKSNFFTKSKISTLVVPTKYKFAIDLINYLNIDLKDFQRIGEIVIPMINLMESPANRGGSSKHFNKTVPYFATKYLNRDPKEGFNISVQSMRDILPVIEGQLKLMEDALGKFKRGVSASNDFIYDFIEDYRIKFPLSKDAEGEIISRALSRVHSDYKFYKAISEIDSKEELVNLFFINSESVSYVMDIFDECQASTWSEAVEFVCDRISTEVQKRSYFYIIQKTIHIFPWNISEASWREVLNSLDIRIAKIQ